MFGLGILKGLGITLKNFVNTFVDDIKYFPAGSKTSREAFARRQGPEGAGLFTVEYPEMKLAPPENFRFVPILITDYTVPRDSPDYEHDQFLDLSRCTGCGICSKVCPPQCIWIVRATDPKTGKPVSRAEEFYIDIDICMNCGYCAEFCPFDSIKMDHNFELAGYDRTEAHIHDMEKLLKPVTHYAAIRPTFNAAEVAAREAEAEEKRRKEELKKQKAAEKAAAKAKAAAEKAGGAEKPAAPAKAKRSPEEIKAQREAMMARRAAKAAGEGDAATAEAPAKPKRTKEEIQAQREAMMAKRAAKAAGQGGTPEEKPARPEAEAAVAPAKTEADAKPAEGKKSRPDDLKKIEGIGPKIFSTLQAAGISTFAQLAATDVSRLRELLKEAGIRLAHPDTWPEQAQLAANGNWDALKKLQDKLHGGKRV